MTYPYLKLNFAKEELMDHFLLDRDEKGLLVRIRKDKNLLGFTVLLKTFMYLGYPPRRKDEIPDVVVEWLASKIPPDGLHPTLFKEYQWKSRLWKYHLGLIRKHTGFRPFEVENYSTLMEWLTTQANESPSAKDLFNDAVQWCRKNLVELPHEKELYRLTQSARNTFFEDLYEKVLSRIDPEIQEKMTASLEPSESGTTDYDWLKSPPGKLGMKTILAEIKKLEHIREFQIDETRHFPGVSPKVLQQLKNRARGEDAFQMRRHPLPIRITLFAALLYGREMEVTDNIVRIFLDLIQRLKNKADRTLEQEVAGDTRKVHRKQQLLFRIAHIVTGNPAGGFQQDLFPEVGEEIFLRLVEEAKHAEASYDVAKAKVTHKKYRSYRRMMKPVLDVLDFRSNSPACHPLLDGLKLIHRYLTTRHTYYPEDEAIPESLLTGIWNEVVWEDGIHKPRVVKKYFELCVLKRLERALKCKEVWVEGSYRYRNPDHDLPKDWQQRRVEYCDKHNIPVKAEEFIEPIRQEMTSWMETANEFLSRKRDVYIYYPGRGEKGLFRIPKIQKRPERPILQEIKGKVISCWGILDLLDILLEADRQVNFSRFFQTSGQRQVLSHDEIRHRLLLSIFSQATNMGLKRIHASANPRCSYDELLYFRKRFMTAEALRETAAALVNRVLEIRNPRIWGNGNACASDGKHFGSWDQNLMAEWNPHYPKPGVMAYWHVDTNALCIYSQLQRTSSSQVASMVTGLVRHDTEMRVESNYVDSHGQSEMAFPFCRLLGIDLLPRLKRLKYARLYLPEKGMGSRFPSLAGVLTRPVRWDVVYSQYDEMIRHAVAVVEGTGPIDSILRRFNSYNDKHPTYKAFIEAGKALKTIHICRVLTSPALRHEIFDGLNVVENWNSLNQFICYGHKMEIYSNDPHMQELTILCLHLLQNALILVNTLMMERVIQYESILDRMVPEDFRALTPLFTINVNPYGEFDLDLDKPSFLEVA